MKNNTKYIATFAITIALFATALLVSNYINDKKAETIKATEDRIAIDLLSSETQFDILKESSCDQLNGNVLGQELDNLGSRLNAMESQLGSNNADFIQLKKYYSILQIKDYLLMKKFSANCKNQPISILYFYSNECPDCERQGYVLTYLHDNYTGLRIYSLDYNLDLSAIKTIIAIDKIPAEDLPALVINDKIYSGFQSAETLEPILKPLLAKIASSTNATSTASTSKASKAAATSTKAR